MSYATKYYGSFKDRLNDTINVYIMGDGFTGEPSILKFDVNPVVISIAPKEITDTIFSTGCKINIINDSLNPFKFDNIFYAPEKTNYVLVTKTHGDTSVNIFEGYVLPEMYSSDLKRNSRVTIPATDQLGRLDNYKPSYLIDTTFYRAPEYINGYDLLYNILSDADITNTMYINNTLYTDYFDKASTYTIFDYIHFDSNNFSDSTEVYNSKKCLDEILKTFYSRIYYNAGKWHLERIKDIGNEIKTYTVYHPDVSNSYLSIDNNNIELTNHNVIAESAQLTFNPGYNKISINLDYKKPESLIENIFWGTEFYNKGDISTNCTYPLPNIRRWMFSAPDTSIIIKNDNVNDNVLESGIEFARYPGTLNSRVLNSYLTTAFVFNKVVGGTIINLNFKYSLDEFFTNMTDVSLMVRYRLRTLDSSDNNWYISTDSSGNVVFSPTPTGSAKYCNYVDLEEPKQIEINRKYNFTSILEDYAYAFKYIGRPPQGAGKAVPGGYIKIPFEIDFINKVYLDVFPLCYKIPGTGVWLVTDTRVGDFEATIETRKLPNILDGSLSEYIGTKEITLSIFDISTYGQSIYSNGTYLQDSDLSYFALNKWRDSSLFKAKPIQYKLLEDTAQLFCDSRYSMTLDVLSNDTSVWSLGNTYTYKDLMYPDSSIIRFVCNGYDYNVINNSYRLNLYEYVQDVGWRANMDSDVDVSTYNMSINRNTLTYNYDTLSPCSDINTVDISTNTSWYVSNGNSWFNVYPLSGSGSTTITVDINDWYYDGNSGSFSIVGNDVSTLSVDVIQLMTGETCV